MPNENIENYLSIINDTLSNLQEDFDFLYETTSKKPKFVIDDDRKFLLEEISKLKSQLINIEDTKKIEKEIVHEVDNEKLLQLQNHINILETEKKEFLSKIKDLKNEIVDLKGSVRVFLRIRKSEKADMEIQNDSLTLLYNKKYLSFKYDKIFTPEEGQKEVFSELSNIIESVYDGYKICLFVYGQTGSGKTYTMLGTRENPGIVYRALDLIFNMKFVGSIYYTCIEIYNEEIIKIQDKVEIANLGEAHEILNYSLKNRRTESTNCNSQSSRSHLICTINMEIQVNGEVRHGSLCFIDLAGSERLDQSKVEGLRLKETLNINKSLSSLGDVFMAILRKDSHVPYRNSKLTFYLQEYLKGSSRVAMILNVNGDPSMRNETVSTLRFGYKVSECKLGKVEKNVIKKI